MRLISRLRLKDDGWLSQLDKQVHEGIRRLNCPISLILFGHYKEHNLCGHSGICSRKIDFASK